MLFAWACLVACRVAARLVSVGSGSRGWLGLTELTASVNLYWLIAAPTLLRVRRGALATEFPSFIKAGIVVSAAFAVIACEPLWYARALEAFRGTPLPWPEAVVARGDVNALVTVLILSAAWLIDGRTSAVERQRRRAELESVLVDGELRALALQLQPHFLFNTLQLAAEAAYDDLPTAKGIVHDLQLLLRRSFELEDRSLVRVADEIDFLQAYVSIQQRRFGSRLTVDMHVAHDVQELFLPPLLLQPLVENSIRHGIGPLARDGRISIAVARDGAALRIVVRDNGVGFSPVTTTRISSGLGLGVTRRRLAALYPLSHSINWANDAGAIVEIRLPVATTSSLDAGPLAAEHHMLDTRWWDGGAKAAAWLGAALIIGNVIGSSLLAEPGFANERRLMPGTLAVWLPVQLIVVALTVVVWRANAVRRWLHERDAETTILQAQVEDTRRQVAALRIGKDVMLTALDGLFQANTARDFDRRIVNASELMRSHT